MSWEGFRPQWPLFTVLRSGIDCFTDVLFIHGLFSAARRLPKGPFRTKNTTTIVKIANYYAVVFLLRPPYLLRHRPFYERKNVCNCQENGVHTRCAAIVNHCVVVNLLRRVNLLRVVFLVRRGPLGSFVHSHVQLAIASECFTPLFHSREYIRPIQANSGH